MFVQSGSGKVYAVLADNEKYEVACLPQVSFQSQTVMLAVRVRYKIKDGQTLDPMLLPKKMLISGIDRSVNTLRATLVLNPNIALHKIGSGYGEICAKMLYELSADYILPVDKPVDDPFLWAPDRRDDFIHDFGQLVMQAVSPFYPAKDYGELYGLNDIFELNFFEPPEATPDTIFKAVDKSPDDNVSKFPIKQGLDAGADEALISPLPQPDTTT